MEVLLGSNSFYIPADLAAQSELLTGLSRDEGPVHLSGALSPAALQHWINCTPPMRCGSYEELLDVCEVHPYHLYLHAACAMLQHPFMLGPLTERRRQ